MAVTGRLLSPWGPHGVWRKVAMLGCFGLGWLAFFTPYTAESIRDWKTILGAVTVLALLAVVTVHGCELSP